MASNGSETPLGDLHDQNATSSSSSVSSLPPLIRPPAHDSNSFDVITGYQLQSTSFQLYLHSTETQSTSVEHSIASHNVTTSSESISGVSDAATAHLDSDVDTTALSVTHHSASSAAGQSSSPEPGPTCINVNVAIRSSSSLTSSISPDLVQPSCSTTRKRTSGLTGLADSKKAKYEVGSSDTSTSGKETSTSNNTTTTSNTSTEHHGDTSHDDPSSAHHDDLSHEDHGDSSHHGDMSRDDGHHAEVDPDNPERRHDEQKDVVEVMSSRKSVHRRSDCAEMNVWPAYNRNRKLTVAEQDVMSSQCDLLFDATEDQPIDDKCSQPLTSTYIYLSLSCVPPSQENYPNISRIRPTSPTDISALIDAGGEHDMHLMMSQTQNTETQASSFHSKNHQQRLCMQGSQVDGILITHEGQAPLTQVPSKTTDNQVIVIGDESSEPTSRFQLERPVISLPETDNSNEGISESVKTVMVFRKNTTPMKSHEHMSSRPECELDIDADFDSALPLPTRRPSNVITHLVTSSDMTTSDRQGRQEYSDERISTNIYELDTDKVCGSDRGKSDDVLRSVGKTRVNRTLDSEQTVCYDIGDVCMNLVSQSAVSDVIDGKGCTGVSSGKQSSHSENSRLETIMVAEKQSVSTRAGCEQVTAAVEQCVIDDVVERSTDVGVRSKNIGSNATVSCSQSRVSRVTQRRKRVKIRKRGQLPRAAFTRIAEKYIKQLKQADKKTEKHSSPSSPNLSSLWTKKRKTSQAVQTSLTSGDRICRITKHTTVFKQTITITEDLVGGNIVNRSVQQKMETLNHSSDVHDEIVSPVSEARSLHSSSADLADVSSVSVSSSVGRPKLSSAFKVAPLVLATPETTSMSDVGTAAADNASVVAESLVTNTRSVSATLDTGVQCSSNLIVEESPSKSPSDHRPFAVLFARVRDDAGSKESDGRKRSVGVNSVESTKSSSGSKRSLDRRSSSGMQSILQSKSSSGGKQSAEKRSSSNLFSADSSDSLGRRSISAALSRCSTVALDAASASVFRLPLPVLCSKRSSTGSSGSRRSSGNLLDRSSTLNVEHANDWIPVSNECSISEVSRSVHVSNADVNPAPSLVDSPIPSQIDLRPGMSVMALWSDKHYYPATVLSLDNKKRAKVKFVEDESVSWLKMAGVVCCELVPVGLHVLAKRVETNWSEPAIVVSHYTDHNTNIPLTGYNVQFDSSDSITRVPKSQISLDQAQMTKMKTYLKSTGVRPVCHPRGTPSVGTEDTRSPPADVGSVAQPIPNTETTTANVTAATPTTVESCLQTCCVTEPTCGSSSRALSVGSAVYAAWKDKYFYPGYVSEYNDEQQRWVVSFEDGNKCSIDAADIILVELLPLSLDVLALRTNGLDYQESARIIGHYKSCNDIGYIVEFCADKFHCRVSRKDVSLHPTKAKSSLNRVFNSYCGRGSIIFRVSRKDVSLHPTKAQSLLNSFGVVDAANYRAPVEQSKSRLRTSSTPKRYLKGVTPSSRTASGRRPKAEESLIDVVLQAKGQLKTRRKLINDIEPDAASTPTSPAVKLRIPMPTEESPEFHTPSTTSMATEIPFDKEDLLEKISSLGGTVVNKFDLENVQCLDKYFLVSDTYHRTQKYFMALAAGIPCISHIWIYHLCADGVLKDYEPYLLPTGFSLETNKVIEWNNASSPLAGLLVVLASEKDDLKMWLDVLETAGCHVLTRLTSELSRKRAGTHKSVDVIVADKFVSGATVRQAERRQIPIVSVEWVIQCLITGQRLTFAGHPKYAHNFE